MLIASRMKLSVVYLITLSYATLTVSSRLESDHREVVSRALGLRAQSVDTTDLICEIGQSNTDAPVETKVISYFLALGTIGELGPVETHQISQDIFASVEDHISWCYSNENDSFETSGTGSRDRDSGFGVKIYDYGDRKRRRANSKRRQRLLEVARELGILSVGSGSFSHVGTCRSVVPKFERYMWDRFLFMSSNLPCAPARCSLQQPIVRVTTNSTP